MGAIAACLALPASAAGAAPIPIPDFPTGNDAPDFIGSAATPDPVAAPAIPRHPQMAPNGLSNLHDDAYMSDTYTWSGPLGRGMTMKSTFLEGVCGSITLDTRGRIVTICVGLEGPKLVLMDARTLETLAVRFLPPRQSVAANPFQDFAGGGYFYLDDQDRVVAPTTTRHIMVIAVKGNDFQTIRDYDVSSLLAGNDKIVSTLPDWSGRIWFVSGLGKVGTIDPHTGTPKIFDTREVIANSFSVDEDGGVYIVTDGAMYRFDPDSDGAPRVTWRERYANTGAQKPGQSSAGSGTTPTVMGRDLVAITDNADPIRIVAYRRAKQVKGPREVCAVPVFPKGRGSTDQSLIGTHKSLIVENNYGYTGPTAVLGAPTTEPGLARVDVSNDRKACKTIWTSDEIAPSVVPKVSLRNGLVYTYTNERDSRDPWYLTGLDFRTGKTVFKALAGQSLGVNNNYAPVTIAPDGTVYVGVLGGMVMLRDARDPNEVEPRAPRIAMALKRSKGGGLRASLSGEGNGLVASVDYRIAGKAAAKRSKTSPFRRTLRQAGLQRGKRYTASARVKLRDGRSFTYKARFTRR